MVTRIEGSPTRSCTSSPVADQGKKYVPSAHTDATDGVDTLEAMAHATRDRGYAYFGVADHSRSAHYVGGLSVDQIAAQHRDIDRLNKRFGDGFRIFKGIESDILADGSLDYPDDILATFDFVVASVHSRFRMDPKEQTARIVRAVANPRTTILGHMTGRQLLRRPGYEVDIEKILKACAQPRRRSRDQRQSVAARPRLAMASPRAGARVHAQHQSRCSLDGRN